MMDRKILATQVFETEIEQLKFVKDNLNDDFNKAVDSILQINGRVVITGMGKSGHIGVKISATLASTGTPSFFMHPAEALHGDLGMLTKDDVVILISNSGETEEIIRVIPYIKENGIKSIAMSGNSNSTLVKEADVFLNIAVKEEACPLQLAPTSSTTVTLVMGDALAIALMKVKEFKSENFAMFHPGGSLGRRLLTRVKDVIDKKKLPLVNSQSDFSEIVNNMTTGKMGLCIVMEDNQVVGIITDGDLRRALLSSSKSRFEFIAQEIMTTEPKSISQEEKLIDAEALMLKNKIDKLLVNDNGKLVGVFQLYDIGTF